MAKKRKKKLPNELQVIPNADKDSWKEKWYKDYKLRIACVEKDYGTVEWSRYERNLSKK